MVCGVCRVQLKPIIGFWCLVAREPKKKPLRREELRRAFDGELGAEFGPVLSPAQLARLLGYSRATIYQWVAAGRLDGSFRKRGKGVRFWRDRVLDIFFNGPPWGEQEE